MKAYLKDYIGDKAFYRMVALVTLPIMVQNFISNFVSMLDNIMVASLGTEQMSGVSIVNQILFVYNLTVFGVVGGVGIFTAQFYGKGDIGGIRHTMRFKILCCGAVTLLGMAILLLFGDQLISLFLHQGDYEGDLTLTFQMAKQYLRVIFWQLPFFAWISCLSSTLRETGETMMPMVAGFVAVVVNLIFNMLLIFGYLGFPALGVTGAAIATLIARIVETSILSVFILRNRARFPYCQKLFATFAMPKRLLRDIAVKGTPLLLNECFWGAGMTILGIAYSLHGIEVVAGYSISSTITNLFNISFMAQGIGTGIIVGNRLGENAFDEARRTVKRMVLVAILIGVSVTVCTLCLAPLIVGFFNTSGESRELAIYFIRVSALFVPMVSLINTAYFTIRSGGQAILTFLFDSVFVCLIQVPLAFSLTLLAGLDIHIVYACVLACDIIKAIIGITLVKKGVWVHNIVNG